MCIIPHSLCKHTNTTITRTLVYQRRFYTLSSNNGHTFEIITAHCYIASFRCMLYPYIHILYMKSRVPPTQTFLVTSLKIAMQAETITDQLSHLTFIANSERSKYYLSN